VRLFQLLRALILKYERVITVDVDVEITTEGIGTDGAIEILTKVKR
jgi:hypothetical protein